MLICAWRLCQFDGKLGVNLGLCLERNLDKTVYLMIWSHIRLPAATHSEWQSFFLNRLPIFRYSSTLVDAWFYIYFCYIIKYIILLFVINIVLFSFRRNETFGFQNNLCIEETSILINIYIYILQLFPAYPENSPFANVL